MGKGVGIESDIPNVWGMPKHVCFFCHPELYEPMAEGHTLCARCGCLISIPDDDVMNRELRVCPPCDVEIATELSNFDYNN